MDIKTTKQYRKDLKRLLLRNFNLSKLDVLINLILNKNDLGQYGCHFLSGKYLGFIDCHVENDWILIYQMTRTTLILIRTGTHSDLFN